MELSGNNQNGKIDHHRSDMIYKKEETTGRYHCQRSGCIQSYKNPSGLANHMKKHFKEDKRNATKNKRKQELEIQNDKIFNDSLVNIKCKDDMALHEEKIPDELDFRVPCLNLMEKKLHLSKREIRKRRKRMMANNFFRQIKKKKNSTYNTAEEKDEKSKDIRLLIKYPFPSYAVKEDISITKDSIHNMTKNLLLNIQQNSINSEKIELIQEKDLKKSEEQKMSFINPIL
jgi:hypothetical protein